MRTNDLVVVVAAIVAFVLSSAYYFVLGPEVVKLHPADLAAGAEALKPAPWKVTVELTRSLVVALRARAARRAPWRRRREGAVQLALLPWIAFSLVMWVGAIMWESVPVKLAAIHAGDWLAKTLLITVIVAVWRR